MGMYGKLATVDTADLPAMSVWGYEEMMDLFESAGSVDLDKRWDIVFRLLGHLAGTGLMVADNAVPVGEELVYGPAMYVDPDTVKIMAMQLGAVDDEQLSNAWNNIGVEDTYPLDAYIDNRDWFLEGFAEAAGLIDRAAQAGGVLVFAVT